MPRRVLVLTLILTLLLSGIGFAHPHSSADGANRELLPHFHLSFLSLSAEPGVDELKAPGWNAPVLDHDEDAVYLPGGQTPSQNEKTPSLVPAGSSFLAITPTVHACLVLATVASVSPLPGLPHDAGPTDRRSLPLVI